MSQRSFMIEITGTTKEQDLRYIRRLISEFTTDLPQAGFRVEEQRLLLVDEDEDESEGGFIDDDLPFDPSEKNLSGGDFEMAISAVTDPRVLVSLASAEKFGRDREGAYELLFTRLREVL